MNACGVNMCKHLWWCCCRTTLNLLSLLPHHCIFVFFVPVSIHPRMLRTGVGMLEFIRIWYKCLRACMLLLGRPGRCCIQNRVHCEHKPASSSARLQCLAQLPVAEPLINFTKGGLAEFSCVLSTPGCLTTGFRSLGAWVCAVRHKRMRE